LMIVGLNEKCNVTLCYRKVLWICIAVELDETVCSWEIVPAELKLSPPTVNMASVQIWSTCNTRLSYEASVASEPPGCTSCERSLNYATKMARMLQSSTFDKADLIQGPTLAELNANDENLLEDLNFDDLLLPEENSYFISVPSVSQRFGGNIPPLVQVTNTNVNVCNNNQNSTLFTPSSFPPASMGFYKETFSSSSVPSSPMDPFVKINNTLPSSEALSPTSQHSSSSSLLLHSAASSVTPPPMGVSPLQQKHSTLHELLLKKEAFSASPERQLLGQSVPGTVSPMAMIAASPGPDTTQKIGRSTGCSSRLSSSAPTHLGLEQIWQRREPRQHLLSTGSLAEAGSTSSIST
ncbi:hypothetical protein L9F63_015212, partial [Diploptera punctata]